MGSTPFSFDSDIASSFLAFTVPDERLGWPNVLQAAHLFEETALSFSTAPISFVWESKVVGTYRNNVDLRLHTLDKGQQVAGVTNTVTDFLDGG